MENLDRKYYKYLSDEMSADERASFEKKIEADPDMQRELDDYRLGFLAGQRIEMMEAKERVSRVIEMEKRKKQVRFRKIAVSMAAVVIGLIVLPFVVFKMYMSGVNTPERFMAEFYSPPAYSAKMSGSNDTDLLELAYGEFADKNYHKSISLIQQLSVEDQQKLDVKEFKAHSYLASGQYKLAIPLFKGLIVKNDRGPSIDNLWYLSLGFLANEQIDSSQLYLEKLVNIGIQNNRKSNAEELLLRLQ